MLETILQVAQSLLPFILPIFLLWLGLAVPYRTFLEAFRSPVLLRAVALTFVIIPALAVAVARVVPAQPPVTGIILVMAVCPGVAFMVLKVPRGEGRAVRGLAISVVLTVGTVVLLPLTLRLLSAIFPANFQVPVASVAAKLLPPILIPLAVGMALGALVPDVARRLLPWVKRVFYVSLSFAAVVLLLAGYKAIEQLSGASVAAMAIMLALSLVAGHLMGGRDPEVRALLAVTAVFGNPAVVLFVAATSYPQLKLGPLVAFYLILRLLFIGAYQLLAKAGREHRLGWWERRSA